MRKLLLSLVALLALSGVAAAQGNPNTNGQSTLTHVGGWYVAQNYNYWALQINNASSVPAASPATFVLRQGSYSLPDGRVLVPYVGEIVNVGAGSVEEAVTLTAVSGCYQNAPVDSCTISGNTSNAHGRGELVTSGTGGIGEAAADAANVSGGDVFFQLDCGPVTMNTGGVTTTISTGPCANIPKTFINLGASVYVTTTVTTTASYSLGIASATTAFVTSCTALTAGTTCSQFVQAPAKTAQGAGFGNLLVTANAASGAGVIHPVVWGYIGVQTNH
jgi:hypothetical protein